MIESLVFLRSSWIVPVSIIATILWMLFLWKEGAYFPRIKFWIHGMVALLTIASLALLTLKPALLTPSEAKKVAVLTNQYDQQQLDSLKKIYKRLDIRSYTPNKPILKEANNDEVFLLGQGLQTYDLWQLENHNVQYLGAKPPEGIIRFNYEQEHVVGTKFVTRGVYNNPKEGRKLILQGPGDIPLDSITLVSGAQQSFRLAANLKSKGRFLYTLIEKDLDGAILSKDPIPVIVNELSTLKVLIVNAFPTFETKYLKNYLAEMGHEVLLRSQLTKGKYKYEYLNMPKKPLARLDEKSLKPFDILIIDAISLKNMSRTSRKNIENAMRKQGLGIFVQSDINYFRFSVSPAAFNFQGDNISNVKIPGVSDKALSRHSFFFKDEFGIENIHVSDNDKTISAYKHVGVGRVGTTTLLNTYEILLEGNTKVYGEIWSDIIGSISNRQIPKIDWECISLLAHKDEPFQFSFRTEVKKPEVVGNDKIRIPIKEDIDISGYWEGTIYPKKEGWNTLRIQQDTTSLLSYFVMDTTNWKSRVTNDQISENQRSFNRVQRYPGTTFYEEPINPLYFFIIFLLGIGYLWLEPKVIS